MIACVALFCIIFILCSFLVLDILRGVREAKTKVLEKLADEEKVKATHLQVEFFVISYTYIYGHSRIVGAIIKTDKTDQSR